MTKENLIVTMAETLTGAKVSSAVIERVLNLLCDEYSFDCGCVYAVDQLNVFHLKESVCISGVKLSPNFSAQKTDYFIANQNNNVFYINSNKDLFSEEREFLNLFNASMMSLRVISDESEKVCALIVFFNKEFSEKGKATDKKTFSTVLNMLGRYVSIRAYENKLSFAKNSLESILDNTGIDIYVNDFYTHEILYANKSMAAPYGGKENFYGRKCWEVLFPSQKGQCEFCPQKMLIDENGTPSKIYSWNYQRPFDGSWFRVFSAAFRWVDGRLAHVVSSADITENKHNEELIKYIANYDVLTNLPNRRMLVSDCEKLILNAKKGETGYVLFFDIDGFKKVNDLYGHDEGDEFLKALGDFFIGVPLLKNRTYRNGGDEFVATVDGDINMFSLKNLISFIHERFKKPWQLKTVQITSSVSVGVSCFPSDGVTPEKLLNMADKAMYKAKKSGGGVTCFASELVEN